MRLSGLRGAKVKTLDGKTLGRVHEVHSDDCRITAIVTGPGGFVEMLTGRTAGRRIPWECVRKIAAGEVVVTPDPPQRLAKPRASRSPRGTPRPSARRSKR